MPETLSRLAGPVNLSGSTATYFTGTGGHTYAIRAIRILNNTAAPITVKVGIGGVTDALLIIPAVTIMPGAAWDDDGLHVLSGTETLQANASATGATLEVSGLDIS
jgi:hypothetical protein